MTAANPHAASADGPPSTASGIDEPGPKHDDASRPDISQTDAAATLDGPRARSAPPAGDVAVWLGVGVVTVVSLVLQWGTPIRLGLSVVDDRLYAALATYLAHGRWLGPYDQHTLAKNPGFSALIALSYRAHVPLRLAEQAAALLAAGLVALAVWLLTRRRGAAVLAYAVLALDPSRFGRWDTQVNRDGYYASLMVITLTATFLATYGAAVRARWRYVAPAAVLAGVSLAAFYLVREEGLWIAPTWVVAAVVGPAAVAVRAWARRARRPLDTRLLARRAGRVVAAGLVLTVSAAVPVEAVIRENARVYGVAVTDDITGGAFARAYADWTRVRVGPYLRDVPISAAQRAALYRVSPAARELAPYLDGVRNGWRQASVHDFPGAVAVWAIRDAASAAGWFTSAPRAQAAFTALDNQIVAACADHQLDCAPRLATPLQSLDRWNTSLFWASVRRSVPTVALSRGFFNPPLLQPAPSPAVREQFTAIVRGVPATQAAAQAQITAYNRRAWVYRDLGTAYRLLTPVLVLAAVAGLLATLRRRRWPAVALTGLMLTFAIAILTRVAFIGLVDTTEFATNGDPRYLLCAHAALLAFGVLGTALLVDALRRPRHDADPADGSSPLGAPGDDEPSPVAGLPSSPAAR